MDEIFNLINQAKASIAKARIIGERLRQRQEKERVMRRRSGAPVIRVVKKLEGSSAKAATTLSKLPPFGGTRR